MFIRDSGGVLPAGDIENLLALVDSGKRESSSAVIDRGVLLALLIMNKYQAKVNILSEEDFSTISLKFPYQTQKKSMEPKILSDESNNI